MATEQKPRDFVKEYDEWLAQKKAGEIKSDPNDPGLGSDLATPSSSSDWSPPSCPATSLGMLDA